MLAGERAVGQRLGSCGLQPRGAASAGPGDPLASAQPRSAPVSLTAPSGCDAGGQRWGLQEGRGQAELRRGAWQVCSAEMAFDRGD